MLEFGKQLSLIHYWVYWLFVYDFWLLHFFHGKNLTSSFLSNFPDFAKAPLADRVHDFEKIFRNVLTISKLRHISRLSFVLQLFWYPSFGLMINKQLWYFLSSRSQRVRFARQLRRMSRSLCIPHFQMKIISMFRW